MKIHVAGEFHLACTMRRAYNMLGFDLVEAERADLTFIAVDVFDHSKLGEAATEFYKHVKVGGDTKLGGPVIIASQVPPGTIRKWCSALGPVARPVYYQVDTIIVSKALERVCRPEQIVIGCESPEAPLPLSYQEFLLAFDCSILKMRYESAELAKCAINFMLIEQIKTANALFKMCKSVGAAYDDVRAVLHNDARIGKKAYLRPGQTNQHLSRDCDTLEKLLRSGSIESNEQ